MRTLIVSTLILLFATIASAAEQSYLRSVAILDNKNFVVITSEPKGTVYTLISVEDDKLRLKDMAVVKIDAFGVASLEAARDVVNTRQKD
jgi:hypothetical protein